MVVAQKTLTYQPREGIKTKYYHSLPSKRLRKPGDLGLHFNSQKVKVFNFHRNDLGAAGWELLEGDYIHHVVRLVAVEAACWLKLPPYDAAQALDCSWVADVVGDFSSVLKIGNKLRWRNTLKNGDEALHREGI
jgi:hypothetical protein